MHETSSDQLTSLEFLALTLVLILLVLLAYLYPHTPEPECPDPLLVPHTHPCSLTLPDLGPA